MLPAGTTAADSGHAAGDARHPNPPQSSRLYALINALFHRTSLEALPRKRLLPPSPERKQRRKTSNGVY
ncbi:hypothetical protein JB92DRAFT_3140969 [Gautieria morchelliformis]|nr:hypothetical protein JB92DRAFT_3140969 [Gautieria morchelliformis]